MIGILDRNPRPKMSTEMEAALTKPATRNVQATAVSQGGGIRRADTDGNEIEAGATDQSWRRQVGFSSAMGILGALDRVARPTSRRRPQLRCDCVLPDDSQMKPRNAAVQGRARSLMGAAPLIWSLQHGRPSPQWSLSTTDGSGPMPRLSLPIRYRTGAARRCTGIWPRSSPAWSLWAPVTARP